jgi:flagellar biosynthesis protein FlhA
LAARLRDLVVPAGIVASLLVILTPLPPALLDVLLSANIAVALVMLLTTLSVRRPLEFSVFPSLLLITTLGRLVLNVATTRLILTRAATHGLDAAGEVVRGFGAFVAGDRVIVGLVIFAIIIVIQFVVITKGATRISEVAARFALDGMPGRQMAIDADLNAGVIDQHEAQRRRGDVGRQADFFGAMDGASKFVRGDAIAGIVIILINIVGGLIIGVVESGMSLAAAAEIFTKLTIGDGLVTQVPALLISLAAGMLVTRSNDETNLPSQLISQLFARPEVLAVTAGFLGLLTFTRLPAIPLLLIGGGCAGLAARLFRADRRQKASAAATPAEKPAPKPAEERVEQYLAVDPMEIEIGVGLIRLADRQRGGDLLERVQRVRQSVATEIGILMPKVRIRDNTRLEQNQYRIKIADVPVAQGFVYPGRLLIIERGSDAEALAALAARGPDNGADAWIGPSERESAERRGCRMVEAGGVIAMHLVDVVRSQADELLTRDATRHLINELKSATPAVVEELIPGVMKLAEVQQVLQLLLREGVPIRQLGTILEALGDCAPRSKDPLALAEFARRRLARAISTRYRDAQNRLHVVALDPALEDRIRAGCEQTPAGLTIRLAPRVVDEICRQIGAEIDAMIAAGHQPIVLTSPDIRAAVKRLSAAHLPRLVVLSYNEITRDTQIESAALAGAAAAAA